MIRLEFDGFTIDVPIERHMSVDDFLAVADKLERIAGRTHSAAEHAWHADAMPAPQAHSDAWHVEHHRAPVPSIIPTDEFKFEHEDAQRLEYFMDKLARQLAKLEETHERLEKLEHTLIENGIKPRR